MTAAAAAAAAASERSGGTGASADSYIGSLISLTSKSEIRYEGVLHNINTEESSIGLRNVRSFGTEGRKKDGQQVPPSDKTYEYILFRGSDIKDLQVKASPPVQTTPPINSDPAIIQSHFPHPTTPTTSLPTAPSGSFTDLGSHSSQLGLPGSNFQSGLPLYQPGANLNSWGPSPPNGSGLAMPMYWQGFYGTPNGMPQQTLLRPPAGLVIPPSMQQMQFSSFNSSLSTAASSLPSSNFPEFNPSMVPNSITSAGITSTSLPVSTLSFNVQPLHPSPLASGTTPNLLPSIGPASTIPISTPISSFPTSAPSSTLVLANAGVPSVANPPSAMPGPVTLSWQTISQPVTASATGASVSVPAETMLPPLVTPGQLLQSGPASVSSPQLLQTTQKDVEVVQVLPKSSSGPPAPVVTEAQLPILPLPTNTRSHKHNGAAYQTRNNFRGRGGRGSGISGPVSIFTEDFDFMAMNEKFKKDEVWGHLGRSNKSHSKDKEINGSACDEYDSRDEDYAELLKFEIKPAVYKKDDFFDSLSSTTSDNDPNHGRRTRYSEQMKVDTQTFGEFPRYQSRGLGRGGGRFRGSYYGGGGYRGHGHASRARGRGGQNHAS